MVAKWSRPSRNLVTADNEYKHREYTRGGVMRVRP